MTAQSRPPTIIVRNPPDAIDGARDTAHEARGRFAVAWLLATMFSILLLLAPALWNGFPLLQWDTGGYLARWFEGYLVPSRSGAYGLLLAATIPLNFWPVVVLQSAATVWILALVLRVHRASGPATLFATTLALSLATTLPFLSSMLLTDIFAGLSVLALYLLVGHHKDLGRATTFALVLFAAFAAATHSATFALLALIALAALAGSWLDAERVSATGARRAGLAVILGVAMTLTCNFAVSRQWSWTPGGYGILFGRMLEDGIVKRYLDDHCPDPRLKLCAHRYTMPQTADEFLWGTSVFNDLGRFNGLGSEMRIIVIESLEQYPLLQLKTALSATARQLFSVGSGEGVVNSVWHTYGIMERFTPDAFPAMRAARQQQGDLGFDRLNLVHRPVAIGAMLMLPLLLWLGRRRPRLAAARPLAATACAALFGNAFICGVLSNPHDRYGARIAWIAPLVLIVAAIALINAPVADTPDRT